MCQTLCDEEKNEKQAQQLSPKEKEVAEAGRKRGSLFGMSAADNEELKTMLDMAEYVDGMDEKIEKIFGDMAGNDYDNEFRFEGFYFKDKDGWITFLRGDAEPDF